MPAPIPFRWNADTETMVPLDHYRAKARRQYEDRHIYVLDTFTAASSATRGHYHAAIRDVWLNLPEDIQKRYRLETPTHLRKHALIHTGQCDVINTVAENHDEAVRIFVTARRLNEYCEGVVDGNAVTILIPWSQSVQAMGDKAAFRESKDKVLEYLSGMIGVDVGTLRDNAGRSA